MSVADFKEMGHDFWKENCCFCFSVVVFDALSKVSIIFEKRWTSWQLTIPNTTNSHQNNPDDKWHFRWKGILFYFGVKCHFQIWLQCFIKLLLLSFLSHCDLWAQALGSAVLLLLDEGRMVSCPCIHAHCPFFSPTVSLFLGSTL